MDGNFSLSVDISGVSDMGEALNQVGEAVDGATNAAAQAIAEEIVEVAQLYVEQGRSPNNQTGSTGELEQDIQWQPTDDGGATVFTTLDYAVYVEFGHTQTPGRYVPDIGAQLVQSDVQPYPFMQPAIDQVMDGGDAEQIIQEYIAAAITTGDDGGVAGESPSNSVPEDVALD